MTSTQNRLLCTALLILLVLPQWGTAMISKKEIAIPDFDFTLSSKNCTYSPDPHKVLYPVFFNVECAPSVTSVAIQFVGKKSVYRLDKTPTTSETLLPSSTSMAPFNLTVETCDNVNTKKEVCMQYIILCSSSDVAKPLLAPSGLSFSRLPPSKVPFVFDPLKLTQEVSLYANEPVSVAAKAAPGYFVDFSPPQSERGFLENSKRTIFTPAVREPQVTNLLIYVTNADRSAVTTYRIVVKTVTSDNPRLASVETSVGRLDPLFLPHKYSYFIRVPDRTSSLSLTFSPVNAEDTTCYLKSLGLGQYFFQPAPSFQVGSKKSKLSSLYHKIQQKLAGGQAPARGVPTVKTTTTSTTTTPIPKSAAPSSLAISAGQTLTFQVPPTASSRSIVVDCSAKDETYKVRYVFSVVYQKGGSTLAARVAVAGANFDYEFDSQQRGPYTATLGPARNNDMKYVTFNVEPRNPRAICTVEGKRVNPRTNMSPYFRVPIGEKRLFRIDVFTKGNKVAEEYQVIVDRPAPWYLTSRFATTMASWVGLLSSIASSWSGASFIANAKYLHFISITNRLNGNPETYDAYSAGLNKWNLEFDMPGSVYLLNSANKTVYGADPYTGVLLRQYELSRGAKSPLGHSEASTDMSAALRLLDHLPARSPSYQLDSLSHYASAAINIDDTEDATGDHQIENFALGALDGFSSQGGLNGHPKETLGQLAAELLSVYDVPSEQEKADGATTTPVHQRDAIWEESVARVLTGAWEERLRQLSAQGLQREFVEMKKGGPRKLLETLKGDARDALVVRLDADLKSQVKLLNYCSTLLLTSFSLLIVGIAYIALWSFYLKDPAGSITELRQDYPAVLKPSRFWLFVLDYALISSLQSTLGILGYRGAYSSAQIAVFGLTVTPRGMMWLAGLMLASYPVVFISFCSIKLFQIKDSLSFSRSMQSHHDRTFGELKAMHRLFNWVPILCNIFSIEIVSVAPVTRPLEGEVRCTGGNIHFEEETRGSQGAPLDVGRPEKLKDSKLSAGPEALERGSAYLDAHQSLVGHNKLDNVYREKDRCLLTTVPDDPYAYREYDSRNAAVTARYPEAFVGYADYRMQNPYDHIISLQVEVQLRHLSQLMSLQTYTFWVPRENLQMPSVDGWNLLFGRTQRGNLLHWILDRLITAAVILFMSCWSDLKGYTQAIVIAFTFMLMALVYIPPAVVTGLSKWFARMERLVEEALDSKKLREGDEKRLKIWPFRRSDVRARFVELQHERRDAEFYGMGGLVRKFVTEPLDTLWNHELWDTRLWITARECIAGPVLSELSKFLTLLAVFLGNYSISLYPNGVASVSAMLTTILALICLNIDSAREFGQQLRRLWHKMTDVTVFTTATILDILLLPSMIGKQLAHWCSSLAKVIRGEKGVTFGFPYYHSGKVRDFEVSQVTIINNEFGTHLPGRIRHNKETKHGMGHGDCVDARRFYLQKTLHVNGPVGAHRLEMMTTMPIEMPFDQFFTQGGKNTLKRLAGTIQIVNYDNSRGRVYRDHTSEDDSFLSLYCDPSVMSEYGNVRMKHKGHGYVVHYYPDRELLFFKGPDILPNRTYEITSVASRQPPAEECDLSSSPSVASTVEIVGPPGVEFAQAQSICIRSGELVVAIPEGRPVCLHRSIEVERPSGEKILVNPLKVKVDYHEYSVGMTFRRELTLRHHKFGLSPSPYRVIWAVAQRGVPINTTATSHSPGQLLVPWTGPAPDLHNCIVLRDTEDESVIDIDPRDTDAHQFVLHSNQFTGLARILSSMLGRCTTLYNRLIGRQAARGYVVHPIPCTIVQCINPLERTFRVEPNFHDALRAVRAQIEMAHALRTDIDSDQYLGTLWPEVMTNGEFIAFWEGLGVPIVHNGHWVNPLTQQGSPYVCNHKGRVQEVEQKFRADVQRRVEVHIGDLTAEMDKLKIWADAYDDANLYGCQLTKEHLVWRKGYKGDADGVEAGDVSLISLNKIRTAYEQKLRAYVYPLSTFIFPMNVSDRLIAKREKFDAQVRIWREEISMWLREEAGSTDFPEQGGRSCHDAVLDDVVRALEHTLRRPEQSHEGLYRSVLHYAAGARTVRGLDAHWRPDPIAAHSCMVRLFGMNPTDFRKVNFDREEWVPCLLKLAGNKVVILFPVPYDATAPITYNERDLRRYHWNRLRAYYVPLECFDRFKLSRDPSIAKEVGVNQAVRSMHSKLVLYKTWTTHVDDAYVKELATDRFLDELDYSSEAGTQTFKIRIARTVPLRDVGNAVYRDQMQAGDKVNIYPLTLRFHDRFYEKWHSAINLAGLHAPNARRGDFVGKLEKSDDSSETEESERRFVAGPWPPTNSSSSSDRDMGSSEEETESSSEESSEESPRIARQPSAVPSSVSSQPLQRLPTPPQTPKVEKPPKEDGSFDPTRALWRDNRYTGQAILRDRDGNVLYSGFWVEGMRSSRSINKPNGDPYQDQAYCNFQDHQGKDWSFRGEFIADEMREGTLSLVDRKEIADLKKSADPKHHLTIVSYSGVFALPETIRRKLHDKASRPTDIARLASSPGLRLPLQLSPEVHRELFASGFSKEGVSLDTNRAPNSKQKELVFDIRRVISTPADSTVLEVKLGAISSAWGHDRLRPSSSTVSSDSVEVTLDDPRPHRSRWARLVDPNLGYQGIYDRFIDGLLTFADGSRYKGRMANGLFEGYGALNCVKCPLEYTGHWKKGRPHGYGVLSLNDQRAPDRLEYYGSFVDGKREGEGTTIASGGAIHIHGRYVNDLLNGPAKVILEGSPGQYPFAKYVGHLKDGIPHGHGKIVWQDGYSYRGDFLEGKRHGVGTMKDAVGRTVVSGTWEGDMPNGKVSKLVLPGGMTYTGDVAKGQRQGMGELYGRSGVMYEGLWLNDLPSGRGTLYAPDGVYEGEFRQGKRHGKGRFQFKEKKHEVVAPDGKATARERYYEGNWANDKPNGVGKYLNDLGVANTYKFNNGEIDAKSQKAYKSGIFGRMPPAGVKPDLVPFPITSHDLTYWSRSRKLDPTALQTLNATGAGIWARHEGKPFEYMDATYLPELPPEFGQRVSLRKQETIRSSSWASNERIRNVLEVVVQGAIDLPNGTSSRQISPYCKVTLGKISKKTKPILRAGNAPTWRSTLKFENRHDDWVYFEVWDSDSLLADVFLSSGDYDLRQFHNSGADTLALDIPLFVADGNTPGGTLKVALMRASGGGDETTRTISSIKTSTSFPATPQQQKPPSLLEITLYSVTDLYDTDTLNKMDPYVEFSLNPKMKKTSTVKRSAGVNAAWDNEVLTLTYSGEPTLSVKVLDEDRGRKDDHVGDATVDLNTFRNGEVEIFRNSNKGRIPAGKVNFKIAMVA